jgi:GntR family transcriptional regulator
VYNHNTVIAIAFKVVNLVSYLLDSNKPIFIQVREKIEDDIVNNDLKEGEQAPSTNQLVKFYKINHATAAKGINQLVEEGILFKKRGIGMFVAEGAREKLLKKRRDAFLNNFIVGLIQEAKKLGISEDDLYHLIGKTWRQL